MSVFDEVRKIIGVKREHEFHAEPCGDEGALFRCSTHGNAVLDFCPKKGNIYIYNSCVHKKQGYSIDFE